MSSVASQATAIGTAIQVTMLMAHPHANNCSS